MGDYFVSYPRAKVLALMPVIFFVEMLVLSAPIFLVLWFILQLYSGVWAMSSTQISGAAWWAPIGGFVAGIAVASKLNQWDQLRPAVKQLLPHSRLT